MPVPGVVGMVVEGLIWSFCLAFGRTPPVGCCGMDSDRTLHAGAGGGCGRSSRDEAQNLLEHLPWDGDLGHLEGDIAAVADDLCADLDQLVGGLRRGDTRVDRGAVRSDARRDCRGDARASDSWKPHGAVPLSGAPRHHIQKKSCTRASRSVRTWPAPAGAGSASKGLHLMRKRKLGSSAVGDLMLPRHRTLCIAALMRGAPQGAGGVGASPGRAMLVPCPSPTTT